MPSDSIPEELFRQVRRQQRRLGALGRGLGRDLVRLPLRAVGLIDRPTVPRRVGQVPGELPEMSEDEHVAARLSVVHYGEDHLEEIAEATVEEAAARSRADGVTWIDVVGVRDMGTIRALGEAFGLHPLVQEDLVNTTQRPKIETYDEQLFIIAKMLHLADLDGDGVRDEVRVEQLGIVLGPGYVLSVQEFEGDVFEPVRERIRSSAGRIRSVGADYLAYALLDLTIDHYFVVIEGIGEHIEMLEEVVLNDPRPEVQTEINDLRREAIFLRRSIWPLREVLSALLRDESPLVEDRTKLFLRDAYDHTIQVVDLIESFRDVLASLVDLYLSSLSHKMNEVMKVLTVIGSIFIPLSFLTGLYGMNFEYIPELQAHNGYFYFLGAIGVLLVGMLVYFKRKGWM